MMSRDLSVDAVLTDGPVLLYDGECGVCNRSVQWILSHEKDPSLRFAPLQSALGRKLSSAAQLPEHIDSVLWMERSENGVVARFWSDAVLATLGYIGGPWRLLSVLKIVPAPIRDWMYRLFAKHRLKVAPAACLIPPPETRARFLDS